MKPICFEYSLREIREKYTDSSNRMCEVLRKQNIGKFRTAFKRLYTSKAMTKQRHHFTLVRCSILTQRQLNEL